MLEFAIALPVAGALLAFLLKNRSPFWSGLAATAFAFLSLVAIAIAANEVVQSGSAVREYGLLYLDALSGLFAIVATIVAVLVLVYSQGYMKHEVDAGIVSANRLGNYYALLCLFLASILCALLASNMVMVWAAIEATTLTSVFLISFFNKPKSVEAAWKYFVICSVGITLALIGVIILGFGLSKAGLHPEFDWVEVAKNAALVDPILLKIAFAFIFVGYGTKMGLFPLHIWLPDAHEQAPTPVSALLSGVLLNIAFYAILRAFEIMQANAQAFAFASSLFLGFGLASLGFAALRLYSQKNFKRLLAYSSVENMGVASLAIGLGGPLGAFASIFHIVSHSLVKPLAFFAGGAISQAYGSREVKDVKGAISAMPFVGTIFLISAIGVAGSLPFGTFFSEVSLFAAALYTNRLDIAILTAIFLAISFAVLLSKASEMSFGQESSNAKPFKQSPSVTVAIAALFLLACIAALIPPNALIALVLSAANALAS